MGTALKHAESSQVFMFLRRTPHVHPWWPNEVPDNIPPLAECFAASLV